MLFSIKKNSFITGFLAAVFLYGAFYAINNLGLRGGHVEDSPSGKYTLRIFAPMSETRAGSYDITLIDRMSGQTVRNVRCKLSSNEYTVPLRGGDVAMLWDSTESYAEILIDGDFVVRISTTLSSQTR